jgi:hypothetical protein
MLLIKGLKRKKFGFFEMATSNKIDQKRDFDFEALSS